MKEKVMALYESKSYNSNGKSYNEILVDLFRIYTEETDIFESFDEFVTTQYESYVSDK